MKILILLLTALLISGCTIIYNSKGTTVNILSSDAMTESVTGNQLEESNTTLKDKATQNNAEKIEIENDTGLF